MIEPAGAAYRGATVALDVCTIEAGDDEVVRAPGSDEAVLIVLEGDCSLAAQRVRRRSVFEDRATAVVLPPDASVTVHAHERTELALASSVGAALAAGGADPTVVGPGDVVVHERGRAGWQRQVHDLVGEHVPAQRLLVGETFNEPGQWSSYPPHKHDGTDGEPALEEVYYYRFDRPGGFGVQCLYDAGGEERAIFLRHGAVVGIPHGYHPVAAAPGYRLYYLWALAGSPRQLALHEDPDHLWLR